MNRSGLPSYYHLSQTQINQLSFHVNLRCVRNGGKSTEVEDELERAAIDSSVASAASLISVDIPWQAKITPPAVNAFGREDDAFSFGSTSDRIPTQKNDRAVIFTYTTGDDIPHNLQSACHHIGPEQRKNLLRYPFRLEENSSDQRHTEIRDRFIREDPYKYMFIMAAVGQVSSRKMHEEVLCIIKVYQSGFVSAFPSWSDEEPEDCDDSIIFASENAINTMLDHGSRLTTYAFNTPDGSIYQYTIERNGRPCLGDDLQSIVANQEAINRGVDEERRELIQKEFDSCFYMMDKGSTWTHQSHVEIACAHGFVESNLLMFLPFGSHIAIRYKVVEIGEGNKMDIVAKGITNCVGTSVPSIRSGLKSITLFFVTFVGLAIAALLACDETGGDFSRFLVVVTVPLGVIIAWVTVGDEGQYHFNHNFSIIFNDERMSQDTHACKKQQKEYQPKQLKLELYAYFKNNFGVKSLAGYGVASLPTQPGHYNIDVSTWKPITCQNVGELTSRMQNYYLGTCLEEIGPCDPVPSSEQEEKWVEDSCVSLFSKGGLQTEGSGSILIRAHVMKNYSISGQETNHYSSFDSTEPQYQRVRLRETVDEVLSRVRKNKRERMVRQHGPCGHEKVNFEEVGNKMESTPQNNTNQNHADRWASSDKLSDRTAEVLDRVRSRHTSGFSEISKNTKRSAPR